MSAVAAGLFYEQQSGKILLKPYSKFPVKGLTEINYFRQQDMEIQPLPGAEFAAVYNINKLIIADKFKQVPELHLATASHLAPSLSWKLINQGLRV